MRPDRCPVEENPRPPSPSPSFPSPSLPSPSCSRRTFTGALLSLLAAPSLAPGQQPRRIVSTAPSITEALFALNLGPQVVGVSQYCDFPPEVSKLPRVGSYIKPNLEAIARLAPDLVILQTAPPGLADRLQVLHIPFVEVPHGTLPEVFTGIQLIAKSAGVPDRSTPLIDRIQSSLEAIRVRARKTASSRAIVILSRTPGALTNVTAVGPDNYLNELLEIAGGINALAKPGLPRYPHISLEAILHEDPAVIIDLSGMQDSEATREAERLILIALWRQNQALTAARNGHIYFGTSNALLVPGPRAPQAAELLYGYMHNDAGGSRT